MKKCDLAPQKFHIRNDAFDTTKGSSAMNLRVNSGEYLPQAITLLRDRAT